jgi:iron complex transport system permease protein
VTTANPAKSARPGQAGRTGSGAGAGLPAPASLTGSGAGAGLPAPASLTGSGAGAGLPAPASLTGSGAGSASPAQASPGRAAGLAGPRRAGIPVLLATVVLLIAVFVGVAVGPADLSLAQVAAALVAHLPWHPHVAVSALNSAIIWQLRLPRVVLGALVGAMLAGGGAAYQGVFRNPLADPYLLGVAAGAGLGATIVIVSGGNQALLPPAAMLGATGAVLLTYMLGASGRADSPAAARGSTSSILLAGIAIAALLTAFQTYLQEEHASTLASVYSWILGGLSAATWSDVGLVLPYIAVSVIALLAHRRLLDVLRVGELEATSLGVNVPRLRLLVVMAATLGVSAAVSVSGLIGFVGIIVPHAIRLTAGPSYRILMPVSMIGGAAFLVLADVAARTVQAPAEVPLGVITALAGAPFFLFVLKSRRARQELS